MLKRFVIALALVLLTGFRANGADTTLQQIADALDVSTMKTFQFTGNGRMWHVGQIDQPDGGVAEILRKELNPHVRLHRGSDARSNGPHPGRGAAQRRRRSAA